MADFDLSLVVRGTDEGASATGKKVEDAFTRLVAAEERVHAASTKVAQTTAALKGQQDAASTAALRLVQAEEKLARAHANAASKAVLMGETLKASRVNLANFGSQVQDVTSSLALGISPMTVLAQQAGQTAFALTGLGGKAGMVARFFAGPWGSIIIAATAILGNFALSSQEAAQKQEDLGDMADYVGRAQSQLGKVIDLVTGKFNNQNVVVREAIRLQAILAQQQARKEGIEAGKRISGQVLSARAFDAGQAAGFVGGKPVSGVEDFARLVANYKANANASFTDFRRSVEEMARSGKLQGIDAQAAMVDALKIAAARGDVRANQDIQDVLDGKKALPDYLRKTGRTPKPKKEPKGPKGPDPFVNAEFGRDSADRILQITKGFSDTPAQVDRVRAALSQLNDLIDDIQHKKPPNMKELLADATAAKGVIEAGLNKPFNDFLLDQQKSLEVARLITAGREDEAQALGIIQRLEEQMGPLTQQRKDAVLATVQALKQEEKQAEILRQKQQQQLDLLNDVKDAVKGIIADPVKGLADFPKKIIAGIANLRTEQVFDKLFGKAFRDLQDKITGDDKAKAASERMAAAVDEAAEANKRATLAVADLASGARTAASALRGTAASSAGGGGGGFVDPLAPLPEGGTGTSDPGAITVTGQRQTGIVGILQGLSKGVGLSDQAAQTIGRVGGKAFGGAATGAMVNSVMKPLGKALGFKTSSTGAQIGGAVGAFIPIPGGDIIGSIVGSLIGGAFKTTKKGSATITNAYDAANVTGNNAAFQKAAGGLAESVQSGLLSIAQQLGGTLGNFAVSIGVRHGDYRVDTSGSGRTKISAGAKDFNDDEAGAIAYAIRDAIKDGAITGLSAAVQRALNSTDNVDKALNEAVKVKQLEELIGNLGDSLASIFKQYDAAAAERVRLAKAYGLDLVKVEQYNGEQRKKLLDDLLKDRLGALQDLQKSLLYGDLFEGDASTRRGALLGQITATMADAEKGVEGASDQLASLYQQLVGTSREAFGTAGPEYSSDRALVTSGLEHIIQVERDRIEKAAAYQDATLAAANQNNTLTNETNNLLAVQNNTLANIAANLNTGGGGGSPVDGIRTTRYAMDY